MVVLIFPLFVYAQEEKEDIGTQEVTVIKSYTPSLQDVFKLRNSPETPTLSSLQKRRLNTVYFLSLLLRNIYLQKELREN